MDSTSGRDAVTRRAIALAGAALLAGCAAGADPVAGARTGAMMLDAAVFTMSDGARLPYRAWLPTGRPDAVILALHGFNDSRDAWEIPAPEFAQAGIAVYAYDQRGFGAAPGRGGWAGHEAMAADAAEIAELLRVRHPGSRLVLMGESMGGAVLMTLAASPRAPADVSYVLIAPAVWGRARMNIFLRATLWLSATFVPGLIVTRPPPTIKIVASDNRDAIIRLSSNPLTIKGTRVGTTNGLVGLMDAALAASERLDVPCLWLYGAHDDLVPKAATRTAWGRLRSPRVRRAYYPEGYHLLLRDLGRAAPIGDVIRWIADPAAPIQGETLVDAFMQD